MRIGQWEVRVDWGHLAFLTGMVVLAALYLADALSVSLSVNNVALVLPACILVFVLYFVIAVSTVRFDRVHKDGIAAAASSASAEPEPGEYVQSKADLLRAVVLVAGFAAYVILYPILRLEPATFLFIAGALWLLGVRRPLFVLLYAALFTAIVIGGARALLSYPMPTLFF